MFTYIIVAAIFYLAGYLTGGHGGKKLRDRNERLEYSNKVLNDAFDQLNETDENKICQAENQQFQNRQR